MGLLMCKTNFTYIADKLLQLLNKQQMAIVDVDESGRALPSCKQVTICGELRKMGESDDCINRWCKENDVVNKLAIYYCYLYSYI